MRIILLTAITLLVAGTCVRLGLWQLDRLHGRREANAAIAGAEAEEPHPLDLLLETTSDQTTLRFRRVRATGTYDPDDEVILYGRTASTGESGNHVLTPLRLPDGSTLLVDRGWIPFRVDQQTPVTGEASAPTGMVSVEGVLFPPDATSASPASSPLPQVAKINLTELSGQIPGRLLPVYLVLQGQDPPQAGRLPEPPVLPELTEGPHLSYAIQWFVFATIALVGYGVLVRRDLMDRREPRTP
jgi:cytochrome oxidase assembly protein ShyY1